MRIWQCLLKGLDGNSGLEAHQLKRIQRAKRDSRIVVNRRPIKGSQNEGRSMQ